MSGEAALGLRMGRLSRLAHAGLAGVTAAQAPTLGEAARTLLRFEPLYAANYRGHSCFVEDAQGAWLRFYSISPYNDYNRFVVDSLLAGWLAQLTDLAGTPVQAERLDIEFAAPSYAARYQPLCSTPVQFAADGNQLRLSRATLQLANPGHCPSTWQHLLQLCEAELLQRTRVRSLGERITHLLGPLLNGGREPDLEEVALHLQLPTWTLRRKLAEEGTRFRDLLNETRRDLAETYIRDTRWPLARLPICWGLLRPRPSSAHSSAGRASRGGVPPQPAAAGLEFGGVVGRFRGVQFVSLGFE